MSAPPPSSFSCLATHIRCVRSGGRGRLFFFRKRFDMTPSVGAHVRRGGRRAGCGTMRPARRPARLVDGLGPPVVLAARRGAALRGHDETAQHLLGQNEPVGDVHRVPVRAQSVVRSESRQARRCGRPDLIQPRRPHALEKSGGRNELPADYSAAGRSGQAAGLSRRHCEFEFRRSNDVLAAPVEVEL